MRIAVDGNRVGADHVEAQRIPRVKGHFVEQLAIGRGRDFGPGVFTAQYMMHPFAPVAWGYVGGGDGGACYRSR